MGQNEKTYRCTRNAPYMHKCIGRDDVSARQGHYVMGEKVEDAIKEMVKRYPDEVEEGFTVQCEPAGIPMESSPVLRWNSMDGITRGE